MHGIAAGEGLPAADCDVDIVRIDFQSARMPSDALSREQSGARAGKRVEYDGMAPGAVLDGVANQGDGLHRRMCGQVIDPSRPEAVGASIFPDIGTGTAMTAKLKALRWGAGPTRNTPISSCWLR